MLVGKWITEIRAYKTIVLSRVLTSFEGSLAVIDIDFLPCQTHRLKVQGPVSTPFQPAPRCGDRYPARPTLHEIQERHLNRITANTNPAVSARRELPSRTKTRSISKTRRIGSRITSTIPILTIRGKVVEGWNLYDSGVEIQSP